MARGVAFAGPRALRSTAPRLIIPYIYIYIYDSIYIYIYYTISYTIYIYI